MYEDRPEKDTPPNIRRMLREYGGLTPDGGPLWRMILSGNKRVRAAGVMRTIARGCQDDLPTPERVEEGVFWIRRYRFDGWILERWFPGGTWGTEADWEMQRGGADGRTRMRAAWPRHGDYFMLAGPWPTIEAAGDLKAAIRQYNRQETLKPRDFAAYLRSELMLEMLERDREAQDAERMAACAVREEVSPMLGSISLSAQRARNQVAVAIGGEDWHLGAF